MHEAVALAMSSDCSSGGCVRLVTVDRDGAHHRQEGSLLFSSPCLTKPRPCPSVGTRTGQRWICFKRSMEFLCPRVA